MPKITVAIPTYNRAAFLRESIPSILNQSFSDLRVLICDNASNDDTPAVVASFNDPRVQYHRQPRNMGLAINIQTALTLPQTEYVAMLSDDDLYCPNHLSTAFEALQRYPEATYYACASDIFFHGRSDNQFGQLRPASITDSQTRFQYFAPHHAIQFLGRETPGPFMTMVCRRKGITTNMIWGDESFVPADLLTMTQIMLNGGFVFGNEATVRYRLHGSNAATGSRRLSRIRLTCMEHYAVGYNARLLLQRGICQPEDVLAHGLQAISPNHVVPVAIGLSLPENPPNLRRIAAEIFRVRKDMDKQSSRFRLARKLGSWSLPALEMLSRKWVRWQPTALIAASAQPSS